MSQIGRVEASREAGIWGPEADTRDQAMIDSLKGSLSSVDSGSLLRIADALEKMVGLLDPEAREARRQEKAQDAAREAERAAAREKAAADLPAMVAAFESWRIRHADQIARLPEQLGLDVCNTIGHTIIDYRESSWPYLKDQFDTLISLDVLGIARTNLFLRGFGPKRRQKIVDILSIPVSPPET